MDTLDGGASVVFLESSSHSQTYAPVPHCDSDFLVRVYSLVSAHVPRSRYLRELRQQWFPLDFGGHFVPFAGFRDGCTCARNYGGRTGSDITLACHANARGFKRTFLEHL